MCGLVGLVDLDGIDRDAVGRRMDRAVARLAPRGPDGEGRWWDAWCGLGHRRLSIVELGEAGAQPMERDGAVVAYNGMIYNYRALRDALRAAGHRFTTDSDTEVLLAGWREWGDGLLPRLNGMFAFAIWDAARRELVLARDRFGKKPLLYRHQGRRLVFASDLRALTRLDGSKGDIDPAALTFYFALRYLPEPWSILDGVRKVPPGHIARFSDGGLAVERWYALAAARSDGYRDEDETAKDLATRFDTAVADRLVADVPVGAFLSSGRDSAIVAASLVRVARHVRTFTVGFEDGGAYYEERPAAARLADHLGTDHTEITVGADDTRGALDAVFDGLDEPFADSSAVPTYLLARETRRHVTVALSGDGADEVFGGYRKHQGELQAERYRRLPRWLRRRLIEPAVRGLPADKGRPAFELNRRLRRFVEHAGEDAVGRQAGWMRLLDDAALRELLDQSTCGAPVGRLVADAHEAAADDDALNRLLAADIAVVLPGDMLTKVDRMGMANALEVRSPFLDHRVVEAAAAMPGRYKLQPGAGKAILRRAFAARLPGEVFMRPKRGFEVPVAAWLTGPLREQTRAAIDRGRLGRQGLLQPELPARWYDELAAGRRDRSWELWTVIAFQAWYDRWQAGG